MRPGTPVAAVVLVLAAAGCGAASTAGRGGVRPCDAVRRPAACAGVLPGAPRDARTARVVRVVDGDTLILRMRGRAVRVRMIGLDAPETWSHRGCFGAEATAALRRLAPPGTAVRIVGDREPYDRYGRRLLHLWTADGRSIAGMLIRAGYARALPIPPNTRFAAAYRAAEESARRSHSGLWRSCPHEAAAAAPRTP